MAVVEGPQQFCAVQVAALGRAEIVIGPLGDPLMANVVFLRPDTAVLEVVPWSTRVPEWTKARTEMECFDVQYEQVCLICMYPFAFS